MQPTDKTVKSSIGQPQEYPRLLAEVKERIRSAHSGRPAGPPLTVRSFPGCNSSPLPPIPYR